MSTEAQRRLDGTVVALEVALSIASLVVYQIIFRLARVLPVERVTATAVLFLAEPLSIWIGFRVWRLSTGRPGSRVLFAGFVVGLIALPLGLLSDVLSARAMLSATVIAPGVLATFLLACEVVLTPAAGFASGLLFRLGLLKTRLVPLWLAWLGLCAVIVSGIATVLFSVSIYVFLMPESGVYQASQVAGLAAQLAGVVFLVGLGGALFWKRPTTGNGEMQD
jgi:hypothetical protein